MRTQLKILVVDDEPSIRDIFEYYFESAGNHSVCTASSGTEAVEMIRQGGIDCCITDLSMPGMDGVELAGKINEIDNTIPIVVMTGYPSIDNVLGTLKNGVQDFLIKPLQMSQIDMTIKRVMEKRSLFVDNLLLKEEVKKGEQLLQINEELKQKLREVETVNLILQELDQAISSKDVFDILVQLAGKVTPCDEAHFCILQQDAGNHAVLTSFYRQGGNNGNSAQIDSGIIQKVIDEGMPFLVRGNNGNAHSSMAIPLKIRSSLFGILVSTIRSGSSSFGSRDIYFLNLLSDKASFVIENMALYENIFSNLFSTLYAFVEAIEAKDPYTKQHSTRVSSYAMLIAKSLGCSQEAIDKLNVAGTLHDIGKIGVPDHILLKPGKLTDEEFEIIKKHPIIGGNIIGHMGMWVDEQKIIRHHHEKFDGSGYPDGLKGEDIPFLSRILSVADVYDALSSDRSYRKRMTDELAYRIIQENSGSQFDPKVITAFNELYARNLLQIEGEAIS